MRITNFERLQDAMSLADMVDEVGAGAVRNGWVEPAIPKGKTLFTSKNARAFVTPRKPEGAELLERVGRTRSKKAKAMADMATGRSFAMDRIEYCWNLGRAA